MAISTSANVWDKKCSVAGEIMWDTRLGPFVCRNTATPDEAVGNPPDTVFGGVVGMTPTGRGDKNDVNARSPTGGLHSLSGDHHDVLEGEKTSPRQDPPPPPPPSFLHPSWGAEKKGVVVFWASVAVICASRKESIADVARDACRTLRYNTKDSPVDWDAA